MNCPNNTQKPVYDNSYNPPRLVGWTQGNHNWQGSIQKEVINGHQETIMVKTCSVCGLKEYV